MSVFRPSNINKRLVGTAGTTGGSPGNGGQIGPKKTPYMFGELVLGCRCCAGCCGGVFRPNESLCGAKTCCQTPIVDYKGFFICCGPGTAKWFAGPSEACLAVRSFLTSGDAVTVANASLGACGWFIPSSSQWQNPAFCCKIYWGNDTNAYWSTTSTGGYSRGLYVSMSDGSTGDAQKNCSWFPVRAIRCTAT